MKTLKILYKNCQREECLFYEQKWRKAIYERTRLKNIIKNNQEITGTTIKTKKYLYKSKKEKYKTPFQKCFKGKTFLQEHKFLENYYPFLTNKGFIANDISLNRGNEIIATDKGLSETFKNHYLNIIEKTTVLSLIRTFISFVTWTPILLFQKLKTPMQKHPNIIETKVAQNETTFSFNEIAEEEILTLLRNVDVKKPTGEDKLPPKLVKCAACYVYKSLTLIVNQHQLFQTMKNTLQ